MKIMKKKNVLTSALVLGFLPMYAGGFQVNLQGTERTGMGNVAVGIKPSASSLFYNPGALGLLKGSEISVTGNLIFANVSYASPSDPAMGEYSNYTANTKSPVGTPFAFYGVYKSKADNYLSNFAFGLGVFTPFGSSVKYAEDWAGKAVLQNISLQAFYVQPTIAYHIYKGLSIGAGLDLVFGSVALQKALPVNTADGAIPNINLSGNSKLSLAYNVGIYYQAPKIFSVGAIYRSGANVGVKNGKVKYSNVPSALLASSFKAGKFNATLPLPDQIALGIGLTFERFSVGFDVNYVLWSVYKELRFDFDNTINNSLNSVSARKYKNSFIFNLGAEGVVIPEKLFVRAGVYYDMSPVKNGYLTPETPDSDAIGTSVGLGVNLVKGLNLDLAFLWTEKLQRKNVAMADANSLDGYFKSRAFIPSVSLSYKF
jgi:long-chain fatty acid transport protein